MITDAPNINRLWAGLLVEELVRNGVDTFCLAPGSRSTPLVTAVAAHPKARRMVHFDERGVAFYALGYGRATGRPAAVITTSGTAAANLLPAVVEAAADGVPMLVLTADRPPELRDSGANQAIDQVKLFGGYVRWSFDLPAPGRSVPPAALLTSVDQAVYRTRRMPAGPVHLNAMFREPLAPSGTGEDFTTYLADLAPWLHAQEPYTQYALPKPLPPVEDLQALARLFHGAERGLIVVGKTDSAGHRDAVVRLAARLGWPVLPDVGSHLRLGGDVPSRQVPFYDQVLASPSFDRTHPPDVVLHLGGRITSKRLLQFLEAARPRVYAGVRDHPFRLDPAHQVSHTVEADVSAFCDALADLVPAGRTGSVWLAEWQRASSLAEGRMETFFQGAEALSEPLVARMVSQHLPPASGLVLASSMPVRDVDMYARADGPVVRVAANRGASGIDGTIATAVGFASGLGRPVTLLIGDLALLHDVNSLALLRDAPAPVIVVVLNNDGGGIFSFLPIAQFESVFEPYFGTPHGLTFEHAAALFGLPYHNPSGVRAFTETYQAACASPRSTLIEVTTTRRENVDLHRELQQQIAMAIDAARVDA